MKAARANDCLLNEMPLAGHNVDDNIEENVDENVVRNDNEKDVGKEGGNGVIVSGKTNKNDTAIRIKMSENDFSLLLEAIVKNEMEKKCGEEDKAKV